MDYHLHYDRLISRARARQIDEHTETHHIVPRCVGGNDDLDNLVELTPEEHYTAHLLLCKIYPKSRKLSFAAMMMCAGRRSNKSYGWLRRRVSVAMSECQSGAGNSQFGTRWIHSLQERLNKKISRQDPLPQSWAEGRILDFDKPQGRVCKECGNLFEPINLERFCSVKCKDTYSKSPAQRTIDANLPQIISLFQDYGSITKTLSKFGITGRQGNKYLSTILQQQGHSVLRRRNSKV